MLVTFVHWLPYQRHFSSEFPFACRENYTTFGDSNSPQGYTWFLQPRKAARATHHHGATESSTKAHATDHFKVPSTEPCCNLMSPLVMTPRKPVRRPSRLRVRKGREDAKTDTPTDMDAAEWISRVLANNGVVEVDPVTMAEQMNHYHAKYEPDSSNTHNHTTNLTSSSEVSDSYFPPRIPGFPRVPLGVALAAGEPIHLIQMNCRWFHTFGGVLHPNSVKLPNSLTTATSHVWGGPCASHIVIFSEFGWKIVTLPILNTENLWESIVTSFTLLRIFLSIIGHFYDLDNAWKNTTSASKLRLGIMACKIV